MTHHPVQAHGGAAGRVTAPFFEIGPKSLLRRAELASLARAAGAAGDEFGVSVIMTVPTALIAPVADLGTGVLVFGQHMDPDAMGDRLGVVFAESLVDAGADGVMLNHDSDPMDSVTLAATVGRAHATGLQTILCAAAEDEARRLLTLDPTVVLLEPPDLIGTAGSAPREWIAPADTALRALAPEVLLMHAGGVASPAVAASIMASGADGTGSTSGVLGAADRAAAARLFIGAARTGWDRFHGQ